MPAATQETQRQPWLKRVLIPFWVCQLLFMLILVGVNAWVLAVSYLGYIPFGPILILTFACVNITIIFVEIILFARRRLRPLAYLVFQVLKTTLWTVLFIMTMIGVVRNIRWGSYTASLVTYLFSGVIEVIVVLLAFIGTLIYASVIFHRHRRNRPYHRSDHAAPSSQTDVDRYKGPFTEPELGVPRYDTQLPRNRDSASAPEVGGAGGCTSIERLVGELGDDGEIREMGTRDGVEERRKGGGKPRELPGDEWIHELSATGSVRGRHEVEGEQPPKVPDKS